MIERVKDGLFFVCIGTPVCGSARRSDGNGASSPAVWKVGYQVCSMCELRDLFSVLCRLPWKELFDPVIDMCRNGFNLTEHAGK